MIGHAKHNVAKYPVGGMHYHLVDHFALCTPSNRFLGVLSATRHMANLLGPRSLGWCSLSSLAQMKWSASVPGSTATKIERLSREGDSLCRWLDFAFPSAGSIPFRSFVRQMFPLEVVGGRGNLQNSKELSIRLSTTPHLFAADHNGMVRKIASNLEKTLNFQEYHEGHCDKKRKSLTNKKGKR